MSFVHVGRQVSYPGYVHVHVSLGVLVLEDSEPNVTIESRRHQHRGQFSMKSHAAGLCELLAANLALVSEGHQRYERL